MILFLQKCDGASGFLFLCPIPQENPHLHKNICITLNEKRQLINFNITLIVKWGRRGESEKE